MDRREFIEAEYEDFPSYAVNYVDYGCMDGLNEEDVKNIDDWMEKEGLVGASVVDVSMDRYFSVHPQFGLASECVDITFLKR